MAQYMQGVATSCYDLVVQMRDHMILNGWTLIHTVNPAVGLNYEFVMMGQPIDATADNRPFIVIRVNSETNYTVNCYRDWDFGTNVGIGLAGNTSYGNNAIPSQIAFVFWLKVNGVAVAQCNKQAANMIKTYFGFLRRGLSPHKMGCTKTTIALSPGATNIPVASNMMGKMHPGQRIWITNYAHSNASANKLNGETAVIQAVGPSAITVSALINRYDSGALVGENVLPVCVGTSSAHSAMGFGGMTPFRADLAWVSATSNQQAISPYAINFGLPTVGSSSQFDALAAGSISFSRATVPFYGFAGIPYHYERFAVSGQATEDIVDDGEYTYLVVGTLDGDVLGPREM